MKRYLITLWTLVLSLLWIACFAITTPKSSLPDSFKVEVIPNEFSVDDEVDLKVTAIQNGETMKSYEWYFDIMVTNANWEMLQSNKATVPDWWWWSIRLQDNGVRNYVKWLVLKEAWDYTVTVSEFTENSIKWETKITVKWKANNQAPTTTTITQEESKPTQTDSSLTFPDSFLVEVSPNKFSVNEPVDIVVKSMRNWEVMKSYEWFFDIMVIDENWNYLQSNAVTLPEWWWWSIRLENAGVIKYAKWLTLKKAGTFKVKVSEFTDDSIVWETSITVIENPKTTETTTQNTNSSTSNKTNKSLSNDEIIQMLNKKWITIRKNWEDFKPNKNIRRDEAAKMLSVSTKYLTKSAKLSAVGSCSFDDLDDAWADLRSVVKESCELWLFKWSNHKFNPSNSITNAQLLTVVWRMLYWMQDESGEHYAKVYIDKLTKDGYLSDMNLTRSMWDQYAKRWDIAKILSKIIK